MNYRQKPITIQALRLHEVTPDQVKSFMEGLERGKDYSIKLVPDGLVVRVHAIYGNMSATPGDWITKNTLGQFYPCKNDLFEASFETAE